MNGAGAFPYPPDDPGAVGAAQHSYSALGSQLESVHAGIRGDVAALAGSWSGQAATTGRAEMTANAALLTGVGTAYREAASALAPYGSALSTARQEIDSLRRQYDAAVSDHERALAQIGASMPLAPGFRRMAVEDEMASFTSQIDALYSRYDEVMQQVRAGARGVRGALEGVAGRVPGIHSGSTPAQIQVSVQQAYDMSLPMLHRQLATQDAAVVASLLPRAASGDQAALADLRSYTWESGDPMFATALMNSLGPQGLLALPAAEAQRLMNYMNNNIGSDGLGSGVIHMQGENRMVLSFLSSSLAAATGGGPDHVSDAWLQGLAGAGAAAGKAPSDRLQSPMGFWALGTILGAAAPSDHYSERFMTQVGIPMLQWDHARRTGGDRLPWYQGEGPAYGGFGSAVINDPGGFTMMGGAAHGIDPIQALLHAATGDGAGARVLLSAPVGHGDGLHWLLLDRPGYMAQGWPDQGSVLGQAIAAACDDPGSAASRMTAETVSVLGDAYHHRDGFDSSMSGLRSSIGDVVAYHIDDVNYAINAHQRGGDPTYVRADGSTGANLDVNNLAYVLTNVEKNDHAFSTIVTSQIAHLGLDVNQAASGGHGYSQTILDMQGQAGHDAYTMGFIVEGRGIGIGDDARQRDEQSGVLADLVKQGIGLLPVDKVPVIGPIAGLGTDVLGNQLAQQIQTHHAAEALAQIDSYKLANDNLVQQSIAAAMVNNGVWPPGQSPQAWVANHPGHDPFVGPDGRLLSPDQLTGSALSGFNEWQQDVGGVQVAEQQAQFAGPAGQTELRNYLGR